MFIRNIYNIIIDRYNHIHTYRLDIDWDIFNSIEMYKSYLNLIKWM